MTHPLRTPDTAVCRHCQTAFSSPRADAWYCSTNCRVAAHRQRRLASQIVRLRPTQWLETAPNLSERAGTTGALPRAELGRRLVIEQAIDEEIRSRLDAIAWNRRHEEIKRARRLL
jgi:hypothetical protein